MYILNYRIRSYFIIKRKLAVILTGYSNNEWRFIFYLQFWLKNH